MEDLKTLHTSLELGPRIIALTAVRHKMKTIVSELNLKVKTSLRVLLLKGVGVAI